MHLLIALTALILVIAYFASRRSSGATPSIGVAVPAGDGRSVPRALAFVSRGKLFYAGRDEPLREIHSPHVQSVMDRLERSRERNSWKEGTTFSVRATGRMHQGPGNELPIQANSAVLAPGGRLFYFLCDHSMGGLFEQRLDGGDERRLLHRQNLMLADLRLSADGQRLLASQQSASGNANIVSLDCEGDDLRVLTGGDTADSAPAGIPGQPERIVFQSCGLARDPGGFVVARGPASIQLLDTGKGDLTPVLEDPRFDHLQPRVAADGSLLFIRRPYEGNTYGVGQILLDALLFPFRLLRALFHYLNFFSLMYSRKPLTGADGPQVQADLKQILLQGRRVDTEAALRRGDRIHGIPSLVPASWQLVSRSENGEERVLATHVASFDIAPDGVVLYSNGYAVFALDNAGRAQVLLKEKLIAEVVAG